MKRVPWTNLTIPTRERFLESTRGHGKAAALLFVPLRPRPAFGVRVLLILAGVLVTLYWWSSGYGVPLDSHALTSGWLAPVIALGLLGYGLAPFVALSAARSDSGIPSGTYVFATHCVTVARNTLKVWPLDQLEQFDAQPVPGGAVVRLRFESEVVRLHIPRASEEGKRLGTCASILRASSLARERDDWTWWAERDPIGHIEELSRPGRGSPLSLEVMVRCACIGIGVSLGAVAAPARTVTSDNSVVHAIQLAPSSSLWRWYIGSEGRQADDARSTWLPEALRMEDEQAYQGAVAAGTSRALRDYLENFSIHAAEVRETELPRVALQEAIASKSIANLRAFSAEFTAQSQAPFREAAAGEISDLYAAAQAELRAQLPSRDRNLRRYFERLFTWLSTSPDGQVLVVFSPPATANLAATDRLYRQGYSDMCDSVASLETHFGPSALAGSQAKVFTGLTRSFEQIVGGEALDLVERDELDDAHPAIRVAYTITSSGAIFVNENEADPDHAKECFIGTRVKFDVRMTIPGERTKYSFSINVVPPDQFQVTDSIASWMLARSTVGNHQVYDVMTGLAFERLAEGLRKRLFDPSSIAYDEMFQLVDSATR
jgi:hypothetical protein